MCTFNLKEVVAAFYVPCSVLKFRHSSSSADSCEKVMHSSVRVLEALLQSNYLPFSQLCYFFYLLMNDCVLMHSSIARARACLRVCGRGSARVRARVRAWLCARASAALRVSA